MSSEFTHVTSQNIFVSWHIFVQFARRPYANVIEAASAGATQAVPVVAAICANLIAFIAAIEFFNTTLTWMGHRIGLWPPEYPELTFWVG